MTYRNSSFFRILPCILFGASLFVNDAQAQPRKNAKKKKVIRKKPVPQQSTPTPIVLSTTVNPIATVQPVTTVNPIATVQPVTTVDPRATVKPVTTVDPRATVKPVTTVDPRATVKPVTTVDPRATVKPVTTVNPIATVKPVTTVNPRATVTSGTSTGPSVRPFSRRVDPDDLPAARSLHTTSRQPQLSQETVARITELKNKITTMKMLSTLSSPKAPTASSSSSSSSASNLTAFSGAMTSEAIAAFGRLQMLSRNYNEHLKKIKQGSYVGNVETYAKAFIDVCPKALSMPPQVPAHYYDGGAQSLFRNDVEASVHDAALRDVMLRAAEGFLADRVKTPSADYDYALKGMFYLVRLVQQLYQAEWFMGAEWVNLRIAPLRDIYLPDTLQARQEQHNWLCARGNFGRQAQGGFAMVPRCQLLQQLILAPDNPELRKIPLHDFEDMLRIEGNGHNANLILPKLRSRIHGDEGYFPSE